MCQFLAFFFSFSFFFCFPFDLIFAFATVDVFLWSHKTVKIKCDCLCQRIISLYLCFAHGTQGWFFTVAFYAFKHFKLLFLERWFSITSKVFKWQNPHCISPVDGWFKFDRNVVVLILHCWITAATGARPESSEQTVSQTMRGGKWTAGRGRYKIKQKKERSWHFWHQFII